jgi:hypothetical protein
MSNADETLYRIKDMFRWGDYKSVYTVNGYSVNVDIKFLMNELSEYEYIEEEIKEKDETIYDLEKQNGKMVNQIEQLVCLFIDTQHDWPIEDENGKNWFQEIIKEYSIETERY